MINDIAKSLNASKSAHAAVLDFTKAFDKVPHRRLLIKLNRYGIRGNLLQWFESFLLKRCQSVICSRKSSKASPVTSEVPQGTVLGPLLFLLYINDLPVNFKSQTRIFADDALVYGVISPDIDTNNLQEDLCILEQWQDKWQMSFNPSKCKIICFPNKRHSQQELIRFAMRCSNKWTLTYLGVTLTKDLKWSEHISDIAGNANKVLGLVKRNFWNSSCDVKETLYKSIFRPKLEYASEIWDPYYQKDTHVVEMIQRKAARFCRNNYRRESSVTELIETLGWDSLQLRRKQARLSLMYKLSNNLIDINLENLLSRNHELRTRRSHVFKYKVPIAKIDTFKFSLFPRTIAEWNTLPSDVVNSSSLNILKSKISTIPF